MWPTAFSTTSALGDVDSLHVDSKRTVASFSAFSAYQRVCFTAMGMYSVANLFIMSPGLIFNRTKEGGTQSFFHLELGSCRCSESHRGWEWTRTLYLGCATSLQCSYLLCECGIKTRQSLTLHPLMWSGIFLFVSSNDLFCKTELVPADLRIFFKIYFEVWGYFAQLIECLLSMHPKFWSPLTLHSIKLNMVVFACLLSTAESEIDKV